MKTILIILGILAVLLIISIILLKNKKIKLTFGIMLTGIVLFSSACLCIPILKKH